MAVVVDAGGGGGAAPKPDPPKPKEKFEPPSSSSSDSSSSSETSGGSPGETSGTGDGPAGTGTSTAAASGSGSSQSEATESSNDNKSDSGKKSKKKSEGSGDDKKPSNGSQMADPTAAEDLRSIELNRQLDEVQRKIEEEQQLEAEQEALKRQQQATDEATLNGALGEGSVTSSYTLPDTGDIPNGDTLTYEVTGFRTPLDDQGKASSAPQSATVSVAWAVGDPSIGNLALNEELEPSINLTVVEQLSIGQSGSLSVDPNRPNAAGPNYVEVDRSGSAFEIFSNEIRKPENDLKEDARYLKDKAFEGVRDANLSVSSSGSGVGKRAYSVILDASDYQAIQAGDAPMPDFLDPDTLPDGAKMMVRTEVGTSVTAGAGIGSGVELGINTGHSETTGTVRGAEKIDESTVRIYSGSTEALANTLDVGVALGPEVFTRAAQGVVNAVDSVSPGTVSTVGNVLDSVVEPTKNALDWLGEQMGITDVKVEVDASVGVNVANTDSGRVNEVRVADIDVSTPEGRLAYQKFVTTGEMPDASEDYVSNTGTTVSVRVYEENTAGLSAEAKLLVKEINGQPVNFGGGGAVAYDRTGGEVAVRLSETQYDDGRRVVKADALDARQGITVVGEVHYNASGEKVESHAAVRMSDVPSSAAEYLERSFAGTDSDFTEPQMVSIEFDQGDVGGIQGRVDDFSEQVRVEDLTPQKKIQIERMGAAQTPLQLAASFLVPNGNPSHVAETSLSLFMETGEVALPGTVTFSDPPLAEP